MYKAFQWVKVISDMAPKTVDNLLPNTDNHEYLAEKVRQGQFTFNIFLFVFFATVTFVPQTTELYLLSLQVCNKIVPKKILGSIGRIIN